MHTVNGDVPTVNGVNGVNGTNHSSKQKIIQRALSNVQAKATADSTGTGQAHADLLDAIKELSLAAESPAETLMRMRFEPLQSAAIRLALEMGVLDAIASKDGQYITASELAKQTGYDALLITRIMRQVTWCAVCSEVDIETYTATETTKLIVTPGLSGGEKHHFDLFFPVGAKLISYLHEQKTIHQFNTTPSKPSPFLNAFGTTLFPYMEEQAPEQRTYFDDYMAIRRSGLQEWHQTLPFATHLMPDARSGPDEVLLVDVGGNYGHELFAFHTAHPDHPGRLVLQDLPSMIEKVEDEGVLDKGDVQPMPYDFFTPQPVKAARAYYFRNICHDWDDEHCVRFLTNTSKSMEKGYSRVLIDDYVIPDKAAPIRGAAMDFLMMCFCSGMERTRRQWDELLGRSGLEIVKVWGGRGDYESVIEARLME